MAINETIHNTLQESAAKAIRDEPSRGVARKRIRRLEDLHAFFERGAHAPAPDITGEEY